MYLKNSLRFIIGSAILALTALVMFITTQAVLTQPPEHAMAYLSLF